MANESQEKPDRAAENERARAAESAAAADRKAAAERAAEQQATAERADDLTEVPDEKLTVEGRELRDRLKAERAAAEEADKREQDDELAAKPFERRPVQLGDREERRLTRDAWKEHAGITLEGVSPHAVHGALAHRDPEEEIPQSEVEAEIEAFLNRRGV